MLAITLVFSSMFFIISIIVGSILGWIFNDYVKSNQQHYLHPEMFDNNGNIIPDEVIAFRFEGYDPEEDDESDEKVQN